MGNVTRAVRRGALICGILCLWGETLVLAQSLAEVAKKEKERRQGLEAVPVGSSRDPQESETTATASETGVASRAEGTQAIECTQGESDQSTGPGDEEPGAGGETEAGTSTMRSIKTLPGQDGSPVPAPHGASSTSPVPQAQATRNEDFELRGTIYVDWFRAGHVGGESTGQLSNRLKMQAGSAPGEGWSLLVDLRDRLNMGGTDSHQLVVYDAYMVLDRAASPWTLSLGQMNLYDSVGIGELLGGVAGYRLSPSLTLGAYGGLEPEIYTLGVDPTYQKFGVYTGYHGPNARSVSLSYNALRYTGQIERQFLHANALVPIERLVLYGNLEYELGSRVVSEDRLSRAFLNARIDLTDTIDVTANYSSGRGLDFHRFLLEQSKDPSLSSSELERFYYSTQYGARFSMKIRPDVRVFVGQSLSEQKDQGIRNHTTLVGGSTWNVGGSGFSFYGSYHINRGDASESDSFQVSVSRNLGPVSWTGYYSSSFNGVRFDASSGLPVVIHIDDRRTLSNDFFVILTRAIAVSLEYEHSSQGGSGENALFTRAIFRF